MSDKIDVVAPILTECASFTANNLVDWVAIGNPLADQYVRNASTNRVFRKGDSLIFISAGILLPENFTFWKDSDSLPSIQIEPIGETSGHAFLNPNFSNSRTFIPMENYESVFDSFLSCAETFDTLAPTKTLLDENFYIKCYVYCVNWCFLFQGKSYFICQNRHCFWDY